VDYIAYALKNPNAAMKLIDDVEGAIYRRLLYSGRDWRRKIE